MVQTTTIPMFKPYCGVRDKKGSIPGQARCLREQDLHLIRFPRHMEVVSPWNKPALPHVICFIPPLNVLSVLLLPHIIRLFSSGTIVASSGSLGTYHSMLRSCLPNDGKNLCRTYFCTALFGSAHLWPHEVEQREESKGAIVEDTWWKMVYLYTISTKLVRK